MSLQGNLRSIREREGFDTQDDLAKASGVSLKSIADYERGAAMPTLGKLLLLADTLKCGLDDLVGRQTPPPRVIVNDVRYVPEPAPNGADGASGVADAARVLDPSAPPARKQPRHSPRSRRSGQPSPEE